MAVLMLSRIIYHIAILFTPMCENGPWREIGWNYEVPISVFSKDGMINIKGRLYTHCCNFELLCYNRDLDIPELCYI